MLDKCLIIYCTILCVKLTDNIILQSAIPKKKIITVTIFRFEIFPALYNQYPAIKFSKLHSTLTVGEDKPIPAG